jgi:hypothetical protein
MADISKTVEIIFNAINNTSAGVESAVGGLNKLEASALAIANPLAEVVF